MNATENRDYYDAFAAGYDDDRGRGYHKLIDDQAAALVRRVGEGRELLEVGCGTGLILDRVSRFASSAVGVDLSPGMLEHARRRGHDVREGSATALPFEDAQFDVAYSFKVLAHVEDLGTALSEMLRVVRPGGHIVFDAYNRNSIRCLIRRAIAPRATSKDFDEAAILTRFQTPAEARSFIPAGAEVVGQAGIRITTVHPAIHRLPGIGGLANALEWRLMHSRLWRYAGFVVYTVRKTS